MNGPEQKSRRARKRVILAIVAVICGFTIPFVQVAFLGEILPRWLNIVIIMVVLWVCFGEIIPSVCSGTFRKKE